MAWTTIGGSRSRADAPKARRDEPAPREKPIAMSPQDQKRQRHGDRFKRPASRCRSTAT
jgi:hypothetical protein